MQFRLDHANFLHEMVESDYSRNGHRQTGGRCHQGRHEVVVVDARAGGARGVDIHARRVRPRQRIAAERDGKGRRGSGSYGDGYSRCECAETAKATTRTRADGVLGVVGSVCGS